MALSIKHPEADTLARKLARLTGESLTEVIVNSLRERLERTVHTPTPMSSGDILRQAQARFAKLKVYDDRSINEILYDSTGAPK